MKNCFAESAATQKLEKKEGEGQNVERQNDEIKTVNAICR
jgi:hypothetical protein